jgi:peptide-methionine (S)-S-oxide reductase
MWNLFASRPTELIDPAETLVGRPNPLPLVKTHAVLGNDMTAEPETGQSLVVVAMGCYWGAEKTFWKLDGVVTTAVGFAGGQTPNPTYRESCGGRTNHAESVRIVFDTTKISLKDVLTKFWESHDPTQVMRQGNDVGTEYRSAIFVRNEADLVVAVQTRDDYQQRLSAAGYGAIATEIRIEKAFYFAETEHQQYLHKNPNGYCGLGGTGVTCYS